MYFVVKDKFGMLNKFEEVSFDNFDFDNFQIDINSSKIPFVIERSPRKISINVCNGKSLNDNSTRLKLFASGEAAHVIWIGFEKVTDLQLKEGIVGEVYDNPDEWTQLTKDDCKEIIRVTKNLQKIDQEF